jgi:hypothetical protein
MKYHTLTLLVNTGLYVWRTIRYEIQAHLRRTRDSCGWRKAE